MDRLDCMGDFCPVPSLKVSAKLGQLKPGESLTVLVDHSCAVQNIKELIKNKEFKIEINEVANGIWEAVITRG